MEGVLVVDSCLRERAGGSPTAVVVDGLAWSDTDLMRIPARIGVSHAAAVATRSGHDPVVRFLRLRGNCPAATHIVPG